MKRGGFHKAAGGFTIIEVMIVLAVSGVLLISAVLLVNGRQGRTEFTTGINNELQQLQQIINETASGYYPNARDFTCAGSPSGPVHFTLTGAGSSSQGTNTGCIFLGKAVQFGLGANAPDNATLGVLPLAGNQYQTSGGTQSPVLTVGAAVPRAAYPVNTGEETNVPQDTLAKVDMQYGLHLASANNSCTGVSNVAMCYMPTSTATYKQTGVAAFIAGDSMGNIAANASGSTANLQSGSQQLSLYGVTGSAVNVGPEVASAAIGNVPIATNGGLGNLDPAKAVLICVASGSTNQSGLFTISGNGSLSVALKIMGDATC